MKKVDDPVWRWLWDSGRTTGAVNGRGYVDIECPWNDQHTDGGKVAGYSPVGAGDDPSQPHFHCFHEHCEDRNTTEFLRWVEEQSGPPTGDSSGFTVNSGGKLEPNVSKLVGLLQRDHSLQGKFWMHEWSGEIWVEPCWLTDRPRRLEDSDISAPVSYSTRRLACVSPPRRTCGMRRPPRREGTDPKPAP